MKAITMLLVSLLIVLVAVIWILLTPEPLGAAGTAHPVIGGMRVAGDGAARYYGVMHPVFLLQIGTLAAMTSLLLLPFETGAKMKPMFVRLLCVFVLSAAVWLGILETYEQVLGSDGTLESMPFIGGFPLPSALAVYTVWGVGLSLTFLYVFGFDRFIYTQKDRERFEALLHEQADDI